MLNSLSVLVLSTFLVASAVFLLLARLLARDPKTEGWLVAVAIVAISCALMLVLTDWGILLERTPALIHAGFAALVALWAILRRTTHALGPPAPDSIRPALFWWIVCLPAAGLLVSLAAMSGLPSLPPALVGLFQAAAVGAAWLLRGWRAARASEPERRLVPPAALPAKPRSESETPPVSFASNARIFVCYRREDSADATGRIYDRLTARFGRENVFKDVDSIPLGVDFRTHLQQVVGRCDAVVVVIGEEWLEATPAGIRRLDEAQDFVRIEIETALQRRIPVVPVLVAGARMPAEHDLPPPLAPLAYRNGIAVRPDPDFHHDMDRLIQGLEAHLSRPAGT